MSVEIESKNFDPSRNSGASNPVSILMVVDLPAPFGPRNPKNWPGATRKIDVVNGYKLSEAARQGLGRDGRRGFHRNSNLAYGRRASGDSASERWNVHRRSRSNA